MLSHLYFILSSFVVLSAVGKAPNAGVKELQDYGPIGTDSYTTILDTDNSTFSIIRLPPEESQRFHSCYRMKKEGTEDVVFCYPSVHIAGFDKCGSSSLFAFLMASSEYIYKHEWVGKEHCLLYFPSYYEYLKKIQLLPVTQDRNTTGKLLANGCLMTEYATRLHKLLDPIAVYVVIIRDLADRQWAAYNFFCDRMEKDCSRHYGHVAPGMFRDNKMFDALLRYVNYPNTNIPLHMGKCSRFNWYYSDPIKKIEDVAGVGSVLAISMESITSLEQRQLVIDRMQNHINERLGTSVKFEAGNLKKINDNAQRFKQIKKAIESESNQVTGRRRRMQENPSPLPEGSGSYEISHFQPLLPSSRQYIHDCWIECGEISKRTGFAYNCSIEKLTTGHNAHTKFLQKVE